jgi:putative transposase
VPRLLRKQLPDGLFHVFTKGVDSCSIYLDDDDRLSFLRLMSQAVDRFDWQCQALCLMTTHYHLVLESTRERLSSGLQRLNGIYAQRFNRRHDRTGHLFGGRFGSRVIEEEDYLAGVCLYVVNNPVRAGLCESWDEWPWSHLSADVVAQSEHLFPS